MKPPLLPHQKAIRWAVVLGVAVMFALLEFKPDGAGLPCAFHSITGLPCAFCGGTRSACALLDGDLGRAWQTNALAIPIVLAAIAAALLSVFENLRGRALLDWLALGGKWKPFAPFLVFVFVLWWIPHLVSALRSPEAGLADLSNPIAARIAEWVGR